MVSRFILPKPISQDDHIFEDLVCDIMARQLNCPNFQRYGRQGQTQYGVDVVGFTTNGLVGIQCKHHPNSIIPFKEIDEIIEDSEKFQPTISELYIITSSDRDTTPHEYILSQTQKRQEKGKYPVYIKFWDELVHWLEDYPDLIFKYFSQYFPTSQLEHIAIPTSLSAAKTTLKWMVQIQDLKEAIAQSMQGIPKVTPYQLTIGMTNFPDVQFEGIADIELQLSHLMTDEAMAQERFEEIAGELTNLRGMIGDPFFSRELWIHPNVRLSIAFLIGWIFRKVTKFSLKLVANNQIWASDDLPSVATGLTDDLPVMLNADSSEIAVVLNISREIETTVVEFVSDWDNPPLVVLVWNLDTHRVRSAAHALSIAQEISHKLKALMDRGKVKHIHLFGALPAPLAALIGYHLNAIHPITIYFLDGNRQHYLPGGTLHNSL